MFSKRSAVKGNDNYYANIEVSCPLPRMEAYQGYTILTTNLKGELDQALLWQI